jgi:hypothetical protein
MGCTNAAFCFDFSRELPFNVQEKKVAQQRNAKSLIKLGAPGWDRTSNPCLRRAVLYPLSYGRIETLALPPFAENERTKTRKAAPQ